MTKIKMLNDRIIFDGHADTRQECETITLMCDNLAQSKDFKTIRYESGYAEFEKVGKTEELKFASATKQTIDVSTLSGWANLATGNHQITIKTKASGYVDSAESNAVTVSKASGYKLTVITSLTSGAGADLVYMVDGEEHTSGEGFADDPSGTYVYENVSTFQFDIDCGTAPSKGAIWSIVSTQLGINLIDQAVKPNIAYSSATFTLTEDTVVTYTTATSGGHKLTLQYIKQAPSSTEGEAYGGFGYYVNNGDKQDITTEGTTTVQNCNTVKINTNYASPNSTLPTPEWVYHSNSFTITLNGQSVSENTLLTLTQDSTIIVTETAAYVDYNNECIPKCCFVAGTKVKTPNGEQPIETLKAGDYITTYNEEAKQYEPNKVLRKLINRNVTELATLKLSNGETLQFNAYHPLLTENGYKSLTCHNDLPLLTKEDKLIGGITIEEIVVENLENPIAAYNLLIENNNNFIVNGVIALGKDD